MTSYRMSLIRHRRRTFLLYKETGTQTWAGILVETGKAFVDPSAMMTQMREDSDFRMFATFNDLVLANTFGHHKASRRWTWHSSNGQHHNQIDYILMRKRFQSEVNSARTRSFLGEGIGNDRDLLMMTFHLCLKKNQQANTHKTQVWPRKAERSQCVGNLPCYDKREVCTSQTMNNEDADMDSINTIFNTAVTETASEIWRKKKRTWVIAEILDLFDKRRELRKKRFEREGFEKYKKVNNNVKPWMKQFFLKKPG